MVRQPCSVRAQMGAKCQPVMTEVAPKEGGGPHEYGEDINPQPALQRAPQKRPGHQARDCQPARSRCHTVTHESTDNAYEHAGPSAMFYRTSIPHPRCHTKVPLAVTKPGCRWKFQSMLWPLLCLRC